MGRFYKTASATPLDYMHKDNIALMERVVTANDQFIDANMQGLAGLDQLANYNHLIGDEEDAKNITQGYQQRIESIVKAIQDDPANWRKQNDGIRTLSKDLQTDYKTGAISKHVYNYNQRKKAFDAVDKQVELYHTSGGTKGVDPRRAAAYKAAWDSKFTKTGYNPSTGEYNVYKGGSVMDNIDVKKALADGLDKIKADKTNQYREDVYGNGWYFNKETRKEERITPEKILRIASDNVNQNLLEYLKSDQDVGLIKGVYGEDGKLINPYDYVEVPLSSAEQKQVDDLKAIAAKEKNPAKKAKLIESLNNSLNQRMSQRQLQWNNQSYLAPILRGLVNTYSYSDVEQGNDLSNNSYGSVHYTQAQTNARHGATLAQQDRHFKEREQGIQDRFDKNLEFQKWKHLNPQEKPSSSKSGTKSSTKKGTDKKDEDTPIETTVSRLATRSFEDIEIRTATGKDVPLLSPVGLATAIDRTKKDISATDTRIKQLDAQIKANPTDKSLQVEREQLQVKQKQQQSSLNQYRNWYKTADDAVINNDPAAGDVGLTGDEIAVYKKFEGDRDGNKVRQRIETATAKLREVGNPDAGLHDLAWKKFPNDPNARNNFFNQERERRLKEAQQAKSELESAKNEWSTYQKVKTKVDKGRENVLKTLRSDVIDNDAIQLGTEDAKVVGDMLFSNTTGYKIFDSFGNNAADIKIEGKRNWSGFLDTDGKVGAKKEYTMTFANGELDRYISENKVKVNVHKVANTTKIGGGNAVAEVTFDDPTGGIDENQRFYVEMTPEMQKDLARKFKTTSKNEDVLRIANQFDDDEGNYVRRQLMQPSANETVGGEDGEFTIFVPDPNGNKTPLKVNRFTGDDKNYFKVQYEDGEDFYSPIGGGLFNGIEHFVETLKQIKEEARK